MTTTTTVTVRLENGDFEYCYLDVRHTNVKTGTKTIELPDKWPLNEYQTLKQALRPWWYASQGKAFKINWIPDAMIQLWRSNGPRPTWTDAQERDLMDTIGSDVWNNVLKQYQRDGIRFIVQQTKGRGIITDEPGLGKTLQALMLARYYRRRPGGTTCLIICPSSVRYEWSKQIQRWCPASSTVGIVYDSKDNLKQLKATFAETQPDFLICSYHLMLNQDVARWLASFQIYLLILDESHYIKSPVAKRTQMCWPFSAACPHVLELSGTPIPNSHADLFGQLHALQSEVFADFFYRDHREQTKVLKYPECDRPFYFAERYCAGTFQKLYTRFGTMRMLPMTKGRSNALELHQILTACLLIRRTKRDVMKELEPKIRERICFPIPDAKEQLTRLEACRTLAKSTATQKWDVESMFMNLYMELCALKIPLVKEFVADRLDAWMSTDEDQGKVLLFAHHKTMLDAVESVLTDRQLDYIRIDGSVPQKQRETLLDKFKTDPECRFAVLSLTAAGCGLNLPEASTVVFCELYWGPDSLVQAEDRAHRLDQKRIVHVYYLYAERTIDQCLWNMINTKARGATLILEGESQSFLATLLNATTDANDADAEPG